MGAAEVYLVLDGRGVHERNPRGKRMPAWRENGSQLAGEMTLNSGILIG